MWFFCLRTFGVYNTVHRKQGLMAIYRTVDHAPVQLPTLLHRFKPPVRELCPISSYPTHHLQSRGYEKHEWTAIGEVLSHRFGFTLIHYHYSSIRGWSIRVCLFRRYAPFIIHDAYTATILLRKIVGTRKVTERNVWPGKLVASIWWPP
jgi:hypothetical protein